MTPHLTVEQVRDAFNISDGPWLPGMRHEKNCRCLRCKEAKVNGWFVPADRYTVIGERSEKVPK